jgi:hypothetical protein
MIYKIEKECHVGGQEIYHISKNPDVDESYSYGEVLFSSFDRCGEKIDFWTVAKDFETIEEAFTFGIHILENVSVHNKECQILNYLYLCHNKNCSSQLFWRNFSSVLTPEFCTVIVNLFLKKYIDNAIKRTENCYFLTNQGKEYLKALPGFVKDK